MTDIPAIDALYQESRKFPPPPELVSSAATNSTRIYAEGDDHQNFWEERARSLVWRHPWDQVLDWSGAPFAKWFTGATLNVTESCLDRHASATPSKIAYYFEGEEGDSRTITYAGLLEEVSRFANGLAELGVEKGDRIAIYMGMVPEFPVALLACARLGAVHSVVFGGFSPEALADRINDAKAKVVITCDQSRRKGQTVDLKAFADAAIERCDSVEHVVVVARTGADVNRVPGRDVDYRELVSRQRPVRPATECSSEDPLFILYTSGTTGKPKGIVHTSGGYLVGATTTHREVFDLRPDDVYWCTADIGWITGHSYVVYGPLANGATSVIYEGVADYPDKDRFWNIVEKYRVTQLYTAPTSIRTFMKWGDDFPGRNDLSSLRILGTVGEPINPEAWMWYRDVIGKGRCPIVDTWWQTETGHMMISPLPAVTETKPGSASMPLPGISADIVDDEGRSVPFGGGGYLVLDHPWPGMARTIYNDPDRFVDTYWARFSSPAEGRWRYFAGDGAKRDEDGYFWLLGRVDDVMNVSGHRISTLEVESALVDHPSVAEAAVIGRADPITGQAIAAFVTLKAGVKGNQPLIAELRDQVAGKIGKIARPASIVFTEDLPKTRSGKIMRRLLRDISEQRKLGDVTTLANADVVQEIARRAQMQATTEE